MKWSAHCSVVRAASSGLTPPGVLKQRPPCWPPLSSHSELARGIASIALSRDYSVPFPVTKPALDHCLTLCAAALIGFVVSGCDAGQTSAAPPSALPAGQKGSVDAMAQAERLGRGMNFGNALEAPNEGDWGVTIQEDYFDRILAAGFDSIRVPIKWSAHAATAAPYTIDETFFQRIDWVVNNAVSRNLAVVINVHHYDEIMVSPTEHSARLAAIWTQIAERYRDQPNNLFFELLNEPRDALTAGLWNGILSDALEAVRASNPARTVIIGGVSWNSIDALESLQLPAADRNLIATVHYYDPFEFTHQGAEWVDGADAWLGTTWGTDAQRSVLENDLAQAAGWAHRQGRPVYIGEFGAYSKADMASRARYTAAVARTAEADGMPWAYWEFASGFGAFDPTTNEWRPDLINALMPE